MKFLVSVIAFGLALSGSAIAANITQDNAAKTGEVIDAVIEAYGGAERLNELNTLIVEVETKGWLVDQSRKTEPPWDTNSAYLMNAIDMQNSRFAQRNTGAGAGFEFDNGNIINGEESFQINYRGETAAPVAEPDYDTTTGPFIRVTSVLLAKQLMERRNTSHWLGEAEHDGKPHDVITLVMRVGPALNLYVDQESHLITRSERLLPPFGLVEYSFLDYYEKDGIPLNKRFMLHLNGDPNLDWKYTSIKMNEPIDDLLVPNANLQRIAAVTPDDLSLRELADGVYHIGGNNTYAMFVEMEDHVVAIGATAGIPDRITELRKHTDKPIRYGVIDHHHSDHVLGVPAYAAEGATLIAVKAHVAILRDAAGDTEAPRFEFVDGSRVMTDGKRRLEIHDIGPTPHSEHLLVLYLPEEGIIFETDHTAVPRTGPLPPAVSAMRALAVAMNERAIEVTQIAGAHTPRIISMEEFNQALERQVRVASQQ